MTITTEAIYENGVLKLVRPLPLREQETVQVVICSASCNSDTASLPSADARHSALSRLLALDLPVADWDLMEEEILRGAVE